MEVLRVDIEMESSKASEEIQDRISIMKMNQLITLIVLRAAFLRAEDSVSPHFEDEFWHVTALAPSVLRPLENENDRALQKIQRIVCAINRYEYIDDKDSNPCVMFSLHVGIIAPLCFVASKCQTPDIRN